MLQFIGLGSAFNTKLGNTSAYIKDDNTMLLFDCGGSVFHRLKEHNILKDVTNLNIIITHTHPDHIGSLGDLIFYSYYMLKIVPTIYYPNKEILISLLRYMGVKEEMYRLNTSINDNINENISLSFMNVSHLDTVDSYGILIKINEKRVYYSGDANTIPDRILELLFTNGLDYLYQDTCGLDYKGNAHLSITKLEALIPVDFRYKVYCMHLDEYLNTELVHSLGFKIPTII